jgi:hypothetical protein
MNAVRKAVNSQRTYPSVDCIDVVTVSAGGLVASKDTYMDVAHVNTVMSQF